MTSKRHPGLRPHSETSPTTRRSSLLLLPVVTRALMASMALTAAIASAAPFRVTVADTRGTPLADAVVSLRPVATANAASARPSLPSSAQPVIIEQVDREFVPRVTVVPVGSRVSLPNNDVVPHNVYSFSAAKQFEFDVYVGSAPRVLTLDKPGVIALGCNIHDWMVGYVVVVDTPLAVKTDAKGVALFADVASGEYELRVWHSQQRAAEYATSFSASGQRHAQAVVLDVAPLRVRYKPPLTLKQY